ncbi:UNVERIFIED_CONTAM: hypothetical protein Sradi_2321000 [Sesamum radiatum]|uniref:Uncharacterized protein n=1 Tax=Sesamum radiatum TaxID=300843 RepID=A0AAW2T5E7_SESRA
MKRCTNLIISCDKVLKDKLQTTIFTKAQEEKDDDRESVVSSYDISYGDEMIGHVRYEVATTHNITLSEENFVEEENARLRLEELEALDWKMLEAQQRLKCYQARLSRAFNKKVQSRSFQVSDRVLAVRRPIITPHRTRNKFTSKRDDSYVVKEVYINEAYKLVAEDGLRIGLINEKFLKRYYV